MVNSSVSRSQQQRAWININHQAFIHNVQAIKSLLAPNTKFMAVIKADAYGHGVISVANTILKNGVDAVAIATLSEGIELRENGVTAPILILGAINAIEEIEQIVEYNIEPTICTTEQASIFTDYLASISTPLKVHLKLDTGMSRLGTNWEHALPFVRSVQECKYLDIRSIYSHLATADDEDPTFMELQLSRFEQTIANLKSANIDIPLLHFANSAATLYDRQYHYGMVRVGLALYGAYPAPHLRSQVKLIPPLEVKARITQIKTLPANTGVSYSHTYKTEKETKIAIVGIGYADGVPRLLSNRMEVIVGGELAPQIGNITMDQLMIDVSNIPNLQVGEVVTILGKEGELEISADDWANTIGTISWEIFCGFKNRLPRINK